MRKALAFIWVMAWLTSTLLAGTHVAAALCPCCHRHSPAGCTIHHCFCGLPEHQCRSILFVQTTSPCIAAIKAGNLNLACVFQAY